MDQKDPQQLTLDEQRLHLRCIVATNSRWGNTEVADAARKQLRELNAKRLIAQAHKLLQDDA